MKSSTPANKLQDVEVMVMDGNSRTADLLRIVFVQLGFEKITVVRDGYEGIRRMKQGPVHLVFADWELRVRKRARLGLEASEPSDAEMLAISGTDFVKRLRQSPHSPNPFVPVVLVHAKGSNENISQARDAGANEVISKPLDVDEICNRIKEIIDDARFFITAPTYKGPCRRRREGGSLPLGVSADRRKRQVRLVRRKEFKNIREG